jgi:hypothetical protein
MSGQVNARRRFLGGAVAFLCMSALPTLRAQESAKVSKEQASYQDSPKNGQRCSGCVHYLAESNGCKLVAGDIQPQAWCMLYAPLPDAQQ